MHKLYRLLIFLVVFTCAASAFSDSRLIGRWIINSSQVTFPPGVALDIFQAGANFKAYPSIAAQVPAPVNCPIKTTDALVTLIPTAQSDRFTIQFYSYAAGTCTLTPIINTDVTITFASDNNSFTSCSDSSLCINWAKFPSVISKTTVPLPVIAYGGKGSISVSWNSITGAYAYRATIKGPTFLQRTVKNGRYTKFTGLPKGSYKVTYIGFFKDAAGKAATTQSSLAAKVTVK